MTEGYSLGVVLTGAVSLVSSAYLNDIARWFLELVRAYQAEISNVGTVLTGLVALIGFGLQSWYNQRLRANAQREFDARLKAKNDQLEQSRKSSEEDAYQELEHLLSDLLKLRIQYPEIITSPYVDPEREGNLATSAIDPNVTARKSGHANLIYNFVEAIYDHSRDRPILERTWRTVAMHEADRELGWLAVPRHQNQFKPGFRRWLCRHCPSLRDGAPEVRWSYFVDYARPLPQDAASYEAVWDIYSNSIEPSEQKPKDKFLAMLADERYRCAVAYCETDPSLIIGFALVFVPRPTGAFNFTLLEYMATSSKHRQQGVGSGLFHAAKAMFSNDWPMVLEVDAVEQTAPGLNTTAKSEARKARMHFYQNAGCKLISGLRYQLPMPGKQPDLVLLCSDDSGRTRLSRDEVECCLRTIYVEVYGQAATDPRIRFMLDPLPPEVDLKSSPAE